MQGALSHIHSVAGKVDANNAVSWKCSKIEVIQLRQRIRGCTDCLNRDSLCKPLFFVYDMHCCGWFIIFWRSSLSWQLERGGWQESEELESRFEQLELNLKGHVVLFLTELADFKLKLGQVGRFFGAPPKYYLPLLPKKYTCHISVCLITVLVK